MNLNLHDVSVESDCMTDVLLIKRDSNICHWSLVTLIQKIKLLSIRLNANFAHIYIENATLLQILWQRKP